MLVDTLWERAVGQAWTRAEASVDLGSSGHEELGVHIKYTDLYSGFVFLAMIWIAGQVASRVCRMPALVGEIMMGICLGPSLLNVAPYEEGWVLIGEIGLVLLVLEAGFDVDYPTLKMIGVRGAIIAVIGTFLPITIGLIVATVLQVGEMKNIIAAGATFGPTSVGIALNVLKAGGVLNTPVGQLVVSAAVIDDMIALLILTQLQALVHEVTIAGVVVPIVSALSFLLIGGAVALFVVPRFLNGHILNRVKFQNRGKVELMLMFTVLLIMMPATYYGKASYLMGAFVSGLAFCSYEELHHEFVHQFKPVLQWLMRVFFAASIGFQVPISDFFDLEIIAKGIFFCLPWALGKLAVGFLAPNLAGEKKKFSGLHLRDCLIVGNSMAAEGEFAFVIAVFSVMNGLIDRELYASLILSVLISTIIPPFALRFTINYYKNRTAAHIQQLADERAKQSQQKRAEGLASSVFLCIQTESPARWNLLWELMATMSEVGLEVIDHRVVLLDREPVNFLVTEAYVCSNVTLEEGEAALQAEIERIRAALFKTIGVPEGSKVDIQRWDPGVGEDVSGLEERLMKEAAAKLEERRRMMLEEEVDESDWHGRHLKSDGAQNLGGYIRPTPARPSTPDHEGHTPGHTPVHSSLNSHIV